MLFCCFCVCFVLKTPSFFALTHSPTCGNCQSKTKRFDDRLSLERARHELKKKRIPDTGRSRSSPLGRPCPIGMHPGPSLSEPSSSAGAPSSSSLPPRTVYAGFEPGPVKGKPSPQATMGTGKGPSKSSKGDPSTPAQDPPFFTVAP